MLATCQPSYTQINITNNIKTSSIMTSTANINDANNIMMPSNNNNNSPNAYSLSQFAYNAAKAAAPFAIHEILGLAGGISTNHNTSNGNTNNNMTLDNYSSQAMNTYCSSTNFFATNQQIFDGNFINTQTLSSMNSHHNIHENRLTNTINSFMPNPFDYGCNGSSNITGNVHGFNMYDGK
uniref:GATA zinc finger domain-containing protein 14-like n=1 Tax=Parastrongyloides trichosuri TaxID=131310 RepID=A0A0N4ZGB6_PARTI